MAYANGALHLRAGAPGDLTYTYDATADTMATVIAAGYFNNTDDNLNLTADDMIFAQCSDGNMWLRVSSVNSAGAVSVQWFGGTLPYQTHATGTELALAKLKVGYYEIGTSIATATRSVLPTPYAGAEVMVRKADSGTEVFSFDAGASASNVSIGSGGQATGGGTGITYDSVGNRKFSVRFEGESFHVVGDGGGSAARWRVVDMNWTATGGSKSGSERGASVFLVGT